MFGTIVAACTSVKQSLCILAVIPHYRYLLKTPCQLPEINRVMTIRIKGTDKPAGAAR